LEYREPRSYWGTHLGTFAGFPPTGKEDVLTGADFVRIADSKMVELWSVQETLSWAQQLGFKISRDMTNEMALGRLW